MLFKRARVACTVEDSKAVCKTEGVLYYKGLWAKDDSKLDYGRWRQPGIELTDEQLWDAYEGRSEAEEKQYYGELDDQWNKRRKDMKMKEVRNAYWSWMAWRYWE